MATHHDRVRLRPHDRQGHCHGQEGHREGEPRRDRVRVGVYSMDSHAEHEQQRPWTRSTACSSTVSPHEDALLRRVVRAEAIRKRRTLPGREPDGLDRVATATMSANVTPLLRGEAGPVHVQAARAGYAGEHQEAD